MDCKQNRKLKPNWDENCIIIWLIVVCILIVEDLKYNIILQIMLMYNI
jgi:hypothetical protein